MSSFHFHPPGNPLEMAVELPFRPAWRRRTASGMACYFCGSRVADSEKSAVSCCEAADYWAVEQRKRAAKWLVDRAIWRLK